MLPSRECNCKWHVTIACCVTAGGILIDFDGEDWEAESAALLHWSDALDFDTYVADWANIGTSAHTWGTRANVLAIVPEPPVGVTAKAGGAGKDEFAGLSEADMKLIEEAGVDVDEDF